MSTIQSEIVISGNCRTLFHLAQDYSIRLNWDPFLKEARLLARSTHVKVGARSWCVSRIGIGMETEYVVVQEPKIVAIRMTKGPSIFKKFAGSWRFIELDPATTKIVFRYHFTSNLKMIEPILKYMMKHEMNKRLESLKSKFENHEI